MANGEVHTKPCSYNCACNIGRRSWIECAHCEASEFDTHTSDNESMPAGQRARETVRWRTQYNAPACGDPTCAWLLALAGLGFALRSAWGLIEPYIQ